MEGRLDFGSNTRFALLDLRFDTAQFVIKQGATLTRSQGDRPFHLGRAVRFTLLNPLVARIAESDAFLPMQQGVGWRHIRGMGGGRPERMNQARWGIRAKVRFHAEVPWVALLRRVPLWITLALRVLGRRRGCDDPCIQHVPFSEQQPVAGQRFVDGRKEALDPLVLFSEAAKLEPGHGIGSPFAREVDTDQSPNGLTVVKSVFGSFVGEKKAWGGNHPAQHLFPSHRRTATTFASGIERFNLGPQRRPRRDRIDLAEQAITSRGILLGSIFVKSYSTSTNSGINQCVLNTRKALYEAAKTLLEVALFIKNKSPNK